MTVNGWVSDLTLAVHMYRQILNVDAAFGMFSLDGDCCLIIVRSNADGIDISAIAGHIGDGGHSGAGSAVLKSIAALLNNESGSLLVKAIRPSRISGHCGDR